MNLKIIDRYLWISTLQGLVIAWLALVLLDLFEKLAEIVSLAPFT